MQKIRENYHHTKYACYIGYVVQAIVNNFVPLLFLTFQREFSITLNQLALLVSVNFGVQLAVDLLSPLFVDRIGYRASMLAAHFFAAAGLSGLCIFPQVSGNAYAGILAAVVIYAMGGGLLEVLVSPIVEACPTEKKAAEMSLLHSFYCWGHVLVILCSTAFFVIFGIQNWWTAAVIWALVPLGNFLYFCRVPMPVLVEEGKRMKMTGLFRQGIFWKMFLILLCAGASEQGMSQWASAFAESSLHISKTAGDLAGPCAFALLMGLSRAFYGKFGDRIPLERFLRLSGGFCVCSYLLASLAPQLWISLAGCMLCGLSVGIMWPGGFSIAARSIRNGGTAMFALLALAGDLGCAGGPALVGAVSELCGGELKQGLLAAAVFPILLLGCSLLKVPCEK